MMSLLRVFLTVVLVTGCSTTESLDDVDPWAFATGTFVTSGSQLWADGTWMPHKGVVVAYTHDGKFIREFHATFDNGASLSGRSVHERTDEGWTSHWYPTLGSFSANLNQGRFGRDGYVEEGDAQDAFGVFKATTRYTGFSDHGYGVVTTAAYAHGEVVDGYWNIRFERVDTAGPIGDEFTRVTSPHFMLGRWYATGSVLQNNQRVPQMSLVEVHEQGGRLVRQHWGALSTGAVIRGFAIHDRNEQGQWQSAWYPVGASAPVSISIDEVSDDESAQYVSQSVGSDGSAMRTVYSDIRTDSYRVRVDQIRPDGQVTEGTWEATMQRLDS